MSWVLIALGAAVGAPARYLVARFLQSRHDHPLPWGTLAVNTVGSFVLGALLGWPDLPTEVVALVGTGFCGAFTTYSALSFEVLALGRSGRARPAFGYLALSTAVGLAAAVVGWLAASALAGLAGAA